MKTQTLIAYKGPLGNTVDIVKHTFTSAKRKPVKRISFVAGLHGNELDGVYLCALLINTLKKAESAHPEAFLGEINIYPAVNPQAVGTGTRLWPFFDTDMNRLMAAGNEDSLPAQSARSLLEDLKTSSDLAVDFHASNLHLKELPQIRIIEDFEKKLVPLARHCNVDLIWVHPHAPVFETTLGYNLTRSKIPTLVIETGICLRIHEQFCRQVHQGMLNLLRQTGILKLPDEPAPVKQPLILGAKQVTLVQSAKPGLFIHRLTLGQRVRKGDALGEVINPVSGIVEERIAAPRSGTLFTLREYPLTWPGAALARIAIDERSDR